MMNMDQRLVQTQQQRLMLTQKMQQAIQILQLSGLELEQYVQQELETNPVLEQVLKEPEVAQKATENGGTNQSDGEPMEDTAWDLDAYADRWQDFNKEGRDLSYNPELAERREYYMNSLTKEESFSSRLFSQLSFAAKDEKTSRIGERIIGDIDDKGYFRGSLEEIATELGLPLEDVERTLKVIQTFEPTGVGARDVIECLLIQIDVEYPDNEELRTLVAEHLEELEHRQIPKIAKAMNITPERVEELKDLLARLDPWPGHEYSIDPPQYVTPDVVVEKIDDEFVVYLSDDNAPGLRLNSEYREMAKHKRFGREERQYIRDKYESAKWLIRNIEQRQQTILKVANAIVDVQRDFLEHGIEKIKPLTLQEIADVVGVHEATVSRTTRGKYMQTPQGLFEMKFFFSPGLKREDGEAQSSKSVQSVIKQIIDEEDKSKPLSDQKIAETLRKRGLQIARRTVTKYREALGIASTTQRREFH